MTPPRKAGPWPLVAITVLVALLSAFLVLRWQRRDAGPGVVKEPPPPPVAPPPPEISPREEADRGRAGELLAQARKAVGEKRWADAEASLAEARAIPGGEGEVAALSDAVTRGREEEAAGVRQARDRAFAALRKKFEEEKGRDRWDAAAEALEAHLREYPEARRDEELARMAGHLKELREEAEKVYQEWMAKAEKLSAEGRFMMAVQVAQEASRFYPEREGLVKEFQKRAREEHLRKWMVRIPDAVCWVGSDEREDEKPLRQVKLKPFHIDAYEVTNEEYYAFVLSTGHSTPPLWPGGKPAAGRERHPVVFVNWQDAAAFAAWAGKRLPTAEEWEVAARGPDRREYPWGNGFAERENVFPCNCLEYWQLNKTLAPGTLPVDAFDAAGGESAFRAQVMGGNVWEWTASEAPGDGKEPFRILKGGSFLTSAAAIRCANVYAEDPRLTHPDVGFRCVRDVE